MSKLIDLIAKHPSLDPSFDSIESLVSKCCKKPDNPNDQEILVGILCVVVLKRMLENFAETDKIINEVEHEGVKQMLLGVQHARMSLSTFEG